MIKTCDNCGRKFKVYNCIECNKEILDMCRDCHEVKDIFRESQKKRGTPAPYAAGDFDSWSNVVRAYEEK